MQFLTVSDVLEYEDGTAIAAIKGKVESIYKHTSGKGQRGPYTYQSGTLKDVQGWEIRFTFWNHPNLSNLKGKVIFLIAKDAETDSPKGLSIKMGSDKNQNPRKELKIEKSASVSLTGAVSHDEAGSDPEMQNPDLDEATPPPANNPPAKKPATPPPQGHTNPAGPVTLNDIDPDARRAAIQLANLRVLAERTADYVVATYLENFKPSATAQAPRKFPEGDVHEIATSIFISLDRAGHASSMPAKKISLPPPTPPPAEPPPPAPDV